MNIWNINKIKDDLSNKKVNQKDLLVYYFLTGLAFAIIVMPVDTVYFYYQEENFKWVSWACTNIISLLTIILSFEVNKGSRGHNFIERIFSIQVILFIRYFVFFSIPYEIFHSVFFVNTANSDISNLISNIILDLIILIRTVQCMNDIQKT